MSQLWWARARIDCSSSSGSSGTSGFQMDRVLKADGPRISVFHFLFCFEAVGHIKRRPFHLVARFPYSIFSSFLSLYFLVDLTSKQSRLHGRFPRLATDAQHKAIYSSRRERQTSSLLCIIELLNQLYTRYYYGTVCTPARVENSLCVQIRAISISNDRFSEREV